MNLAKFFNHDFNKERIFELYNKDGYTVYFEYKEGDWYKFGYDKNNFIIEAEFSNGYKWKKGVLNEK